MSKSFNAVDHTSFSQQLSNCCIVSVQYDQIAFLLGFCAVVHRGNALCPVLFT